VEIESFHDGTIRRAVRQEGQRLAQTLLTCREVTWREGHFIMCRGRVQVSIN
jgi:hypothetical protein